MGGLHLGNNQAILLSSGDYFLEYLDLGNNATILVEPGAVVRLFVGDVTMGNNADVNSPPSQGSKVIIISDANSQIGGAMQLRNNTSSVMEVYAPLADIELENNAELFGGIVGRSITVHNNGSLIGIKDQPVDPPLICSGH
jgi:hypothetical protein